MKAPRFIVMMVSMLALFVPAACAGVDVINAIAPDSGYRVVRDIAYGAQNRQTLDVYIPEASSEPLQPEKTARESQKKSKDVIIFFYGGSWQRGNKEDYLFVAQALASKGYIAVIADYRLYPEVRFPAFIQDGANAVSWVHTHIGEYGGNPQRIFVAGHSAGAYNAMMLGLDTSYMRAAGVSSAHPIKGVIGLAGPYDFAPIAGKTLKKIFGGANNPNTQPIHFARKNAPPVLLLSGEADRDVGIENTTALAKKLRAYDNDVSVRTYPELDHSDIVLALAYGFRDKAPVLDEIDKFIRHVR